MEPDGVGGSGGGFGDAIAVGPIGFTPKEVTGLIGGCDGGAGGVVVVVGGLGVSACVNEQQALASLT